MSGSCSEEENWRYIDNFCIGEEFPPLKQYESRKCSAAVSGVLARGVHSSAFNCIYWNNHSGKRSTWFIYERARYLSIKIAFTNWQYFGNILHWKLVKDAWIWALKTALCPSGLLEVEQKDELVNTYWSGTAPLCFGVCKGRHQELKRDNCGDSDRCWWIVESLMWTLMGWCMGVIGGWVL